MGTSILELQSMDEIISSDTFIRDYLVQNGDVADETTINKAPAKLKAEINQLKRSIVNIEEGAISLDSLNITATAAQINVLGNYTGTATELNALVPIYRKLQYLENLDQDIVSLINDGGLGVDGLTVTTSALNWAGALYTNNGNINTGITGETISHLLNLSGNVENRLTTLENSSGGTVTITESSVLTALSSGTLFTNSADATSKLTWLTNIYDQDVTGSEISYLNGVTSPIQTQIAGLQSSIDSLVAGSGGITAGTGLDLSGTVMSLDYVNTLTMTGADDSDYIFVGDISAGEVKKITKANLFSGISSGTTYTGGTGISVSGSVITNTAPGTTYTAGTGISVSGSVITNTAPGVTYTSGTGITVSGTTISYSGTTVPTLTSQLSNNSGFITSQSLSSYSLTNHGHSGMVTGTWNGTTLALTIN